MHVKHKMERGSQGSSYRHAQNQKFTFLKRPQTFNKRQKLMPHKICVGADWYMQIFSSDYFLIRKKKKREINRKNNDSSPMLSHGSLLELAKTICTYHQYRKVPVMPTNAIQVHHSPYIPSQIFRWIMLLKWLQWQNHRQLLANKKKIPANPTENNIYLGRNKTKSSFFSLGTSSLATRTSSAQVFPTSTLSVPMLKISPLKRISFILY